MQYNLADLWERVVDTVPDRESLVCGDRRLTYAEADERANRLAHHLADRGVRAGDQAGSRSSPLPSVIWDHVRSAMVYIQMALTPLRREEVRINRASAEITASLPPAGSVAISVGLASADAGAGANSTAIRNASHFMA